jgi:Tfp pilus tip-associated adhesin PilY1
MLKRSKKNKKIFLIVLFSAFVFVISLYIALFAFAGSASAASGVNDVDIPPNISQSAPPNVLIFLDTSGSMMWNEGVNWKNPTTGASGYDLPESWWEGFSVPPWPPGSNSVFSKIYNAKMALQDIVTNSSFSNLNYAFATFQPDLLSHTAAQCIYAKTADGGLDFTNPSTALYYPGTPGGSGIPIQSGAYDNGTNPSYPFKSLSCAGNANLTKAYFVSYDYMPYITNQDLEGTQSPWQLWVPQNTGAVPTTGPFFKPQATAGAAIQNILWSANDYSGFGGLTDPAGINVIGLKAGGGTPMWSMVENMTSYYANYISSLSTASTGAACARNYSIIITDGEANGYRASDTPSAVYDLYKPATTSAPNPIETFIIGFGYTAAVGGTSYLQGMADGGAGIDPSNSPLGLAISGAAASSSPTTLTLPPSAFLPSGGANASISGVLVGDTISDNGWESDTCEAANGGSIVYANGNDCATITADSPSSDTVTLSNTLKDFSTSGATGPVTVSGTIYLPNNLTALTDSLTTIFNQIESQTASFTSPVVNQTSSTSGFVYYANFRTFNQPMWGEGNIFLFHLSPNPAPPPQLILSGPTGPAVSSTGQINTGDSYWGSGGIGAGGLLQAELPASRNILTSNYNPSTGAVAPDATTGGTSEIPFNTANDSTLAPLLGITSANYLTICPSAASVDACADDVINFVLNPNPSDNWKLGAIYHSDPVLVIPPPFAYPSASYQQFKINNASRQNVLVAGANDGMVHGFNAADSWDTTTNSYTCLTGTCGAEMFGYIPPDLLPELTSWFNPAFNPNSTTVPDKEYEFIDATPAPSDVYFNNIFSVGGAPTANTVNSGSGANTPACVGTTGGADCWHTIAISGERNGGTSYFALGLTNPANIGSTSTPYPDPLWDFSDAANSPTPATTAPMGNTWSQPVISYVCMLNPFYSSSDTGGTGVCGNNPHPGVSSDTPQFVKTYVGVVGGGYLPDNPAGTVVAGQAVYILYAEPNPVNTGTAAAPVYTDEQELWKFDNSSTGGADMNYQIPSAVAPITSPNFRLEAFYVGDLGGQIWAFDTPGGQDITAPIPKTNSDILLNWTGCPLFQSNITTNTTAAASSSGTTTTTPPATPLKDIFFPPAVSYDTSYNLWLFFGTGNMENLNSQNTRYNELIAVNTAGISAGECPSAPYGETNLGNVTTGSTATATADGWYINLHSNERLVAPAIVYDNIAYFVTYTPLSPGACGYGTASLYAVNYLTGAGEVTTNTGASSGTVTSIGTGGTSQSGEIGTGVPSAPVVSSPVGGKATLTITTQSGQVIQLPIPAQPSALIPTSWFENQ